MTIKNSCTSNKIKETNEKFYNLYKLIIEKQLLDNNTNTIENLELDTLEIISLYRNTTLEENLKKYSPISTVLENLDSCNITETINKDIQTTNNEDINQILETNKDATGVELSTLLPPNIFNLCNTKVFTNTD